MASNAISVVNNTNISAFKGVLNDTSIRNRIRTSMGKNAGSFIASMLDLYESESALQNCDPYKVAMECLKAASLNLPIVKGLGFAYVVPYKGTPTFIVGYKGLIQLALRSGQYRILNAGAVYKGEEIRENRISGQIEISGVPESKEAVGYFAYFQLVNGYEKTIYMTVEEIKNHARKYSKAYENGPWKTEFDEMAKKTLIRKLLKHGPMSTELQEAFLYAKEQEVQNVTRLVETEIQGNANAIPIDTVPVDQSTGEVLEAPRSVQIDAQASMFAGPDF